MASPCPAAAHPGEQVSSKALGKPKPQSAEHQSPWQPRAPQPNSVCRLSCLLTQLRTSRGPAAPTGLPVRLRPGCARPALSTPFPGKTWKSLAQQSCSFQRPEHHVAPSPSRHRWPHIYFSHCSGPALGGEPGARSGAVTAPAPGFSFLNLSFSGSKTFSF